MFTECGKKYFEKVMKARNKVKGKKEVKKTLITADPDLSVDNRSNESESKKIE